MKKTLLFSVLFVMQFLSAQQIDLTIKYSISNSRYEVYAKSNFTQNNFTWGPSQITVVTPASFPNQALLITSNNGGSWGDNSIIPNPAASPNFDFHGISNGTGQMTNLIANQELLIFSFVSTAGSCVAGLRLFINGSDPDSSQPSMGGGDFSNTIDYGQTPLDAYNANYNNTGTICTALSSDNPLLSKINIKAYPNPVVSLLTISGLTTSSNTIELFAYNGQSLKSFDTKEAEVKLDLSSYADGIYFIKIQNSENNFSIKRIIKIP